MPENPKETFYLTTPIYYVNARPHIGHAYTTLVADTIARRHRLLGDDTFFLTGTDEHGQKIERSAAAAGIPPQQFADEVSGSFQALWKRMGITNDAFIRTTSEAHKRGAQKLFADLHAAGHIYLSSYTGQYSIGEEMFVEGPPGTLGPDGKPTETVTEENFFFRLSDFQLLLLNLIESDTLRIQPEARRNEVLSFLRGRTVPDPSERPHLGVMSPDGTSITYNTWPREHVEAAFKEGKLKRSDLGEVYEPGALRDLSVSRSSFSWGIPVPQPAACETKQPHVIYVWLDALANYMTAVGYGSEAQTDKEQFKRRWPAQLHLVGKEIIRFHCVYWPAFLLAAGLPLQKAVTAHGWLLFDDAKMSKSKGNIVRTETILDAFGEHVYKKQFPDSTKDEQDLFASDVLRYFLLREIPFGRDGRFTFHGFWNRYNAELTNGFGNLVKRTLTQIEAYYGSLVPEHPTWVNATILLSNRRFLAPGYSATLLGSGEIALSVPDVELARLASVCIHFYDRAFEASRFSMTVEFKQLRQDLLDNTAVSEGDRGALDFVALLIEETDQLLSANKPWVLAKSDSLEDRAMGGETLYLAAEAIRIIAALLYPFLPNTSAKVWQQLGLGDIELAARNGELKTLTWGGLKPGTKLGALAPIFPRADKGLAQIMMDMEAAKAAPSPLTDEKVPTAPEQDDTNDPAAGPRTTAFTEPNPGASVAGSNALTTERVHTSHTEAVASGPFRASAAGSSTPDTPQIAVDDFVKIDLRVAQIIVAERIPKADKLLRLEVDLGYERRQILSGIAQWYTPEELIGRRIVVIANLAPRKMRGLDSHGMLLAAAEGEDGKPVLATFGEEIALGSRVR